MELGSVFPFTAKLNLTFLSNYRFQFSLINSIGNSTFQEEFGPRSSFRLILAWIGWDHEKTNICYILLSISKPKPNHLQKTGSSFSLENSISFITFVWDDSIEIFFNMVSALKFWLAANSKTACIEKPVSTRTIVTIRHYKLEFCYESPTEKLCFCVCEFDCHFYHFDTCIQILIFQWIQNFSLSKSMNVPWKQNFFLFQSFSLVKLKLPNQFGFNFSYWDLKKSLYHFRERFKR